MLTNLFMKPLVAVLVFTVTSLSCCRDLAAQADSKEVRVLSAAETDDMAALISGRTLLLKLNAEAAKLGKAVIPRLSAPIQSLEWEGHPEAELKFVPEPETWVFSWKQVPEESPTIKVVFDQQPVMPADCEKASPAGDGSVMLHAYQASTFGEKLRFEPQWYKNTVGYWTIPTDYATWDLAIDQPGTYSVAALQGCGQGQGGSDALMSLRQGDQVKVELPFKTIDTGHFQNFRWNHLGMITITEAGDYQLRIAPTRIAKGALFDVRMIHLVRQAKK